MAGNAGAEHEREALKQQIEELTRELELLADRCQQLESDHEAAVADKRRLEEGIRIYTSRIDDLQSVRIRCRAVSITAHRLLKQDMGRYPASR